MPRKREKLNGESSQENPSEQLQNTEILTGFIFFKVT
jgi:hypothetical protein